MNFLGFVRRVCFGVFSLLALVAPCAAETFVFDFPTSLDGWEPGWHIDSTTGTPGVVSHSTDRGYLDDASLQFDMGDGFGDDGTLWIDRQFAVAAGLPTRISVSFQLYNLAQSDFNQFQVKAVIDETEPATQADFTNIGTTDTAEGWVPFSYEEVITSPTGIAWVGVGIRVAWETHRDYWIDRVVVTTAPIPEPSSLAIVLTGFVGSAVLYRRRTSVARGPCM